MVKKIISIVICIIVILAGVSIEKEKINSANDEIINCITYNMNTNPENLQLTQTDSIRDKDLLVTLFEGLVKENDDGEIVPALSKEVKISDDGLEYIFKLRDDIYYSSGEKITAQDFKSFFEAFLNDKDNIYASWLDCIYGAKEFREGHDDFSNVAINLKEDDELSIRLNYKDPNFINILANPVFNLRDYGRLDRYKENFNSIRYTGPFIIKEAKNEEIYIEKNKKYYSSGEVTNENIRITFLNSEENALAIFEKSADADIDGFVGNIDIMMDAPVSELLRLSQNSMIKRFDGLSMYYLGFNPDKDTLGGDLNFRNAINSLLSKEYYSQLICKELLTPATSYSLEKENSQQVFSSFGDIELAKELFNKVNVKEKSKIKIIYEKNNLNRRIIEDLSSNIKENLNLELVLEECSNEELKKAIDNGDYDIVLQRFNFKYGDPIEYYKSLNNESENRLIANNNEEYGKLIKEASYEMDEGKRKSIYEQCEKILRSQLVSIPIYNINNAICVKTDIDNVYVTTSGNIRLDKVKYKIKDKEVP